MNVIYCVAPETANVFIESHKYDSRSAFKKGSPSAYRVANTNGWLIEMIWLNKKNDK